MQIKLIPKANESNLCLSGELTLLHAAQLKGELIRALDTARRIVIDTQELSAIDLACLQLLCSAHQSARARGKEIILNPRQPEVFRQQIARSGLIGRHNCGGDSKIDCFWNGGDR
jgi:anti-anti-sigma regulatory factor